MAQPPIATWQEPEAPKGPAAGIRFAGHPARLLAYLIDIGIQIVVGIAVAFAITFTGFFGAGDGGTGNFIIIALGTGYFLFSLLYFPWFWAKTGQTPGMRALELRVVRNDDGGPLSVGTAIMRLVGFWLSALVLYIGFAWILVEKRRRGWADLIAGTCVVEAD